MRISDRSSDGALPISVEIDGKGHERHALAGDGAMQLRDLALMKEQLARALGLMVEAVAVTEFGYVGVDQPDFLLLHLGIAFGDRAFAEAERLHLGAGERAAGFIFVLDGIIVARSEEHTSELQSLMRIS